MNLAAPRSIHVAHGTGSTLAGLLVGLTVAGLDATRVEGYKGAIGGEIPQRYLQYILKHDNRYYSFTLSALRRDANHECCSVIWPLKENDIALFEQLLRTLSFNN